MPGRGVQNINLQVGSLHRNRIIRSPVVSIPSCSCPHAHALNHILPKNYTLNNFVKFYFCLNLLRKKLEFFEKNLKTHFLDDLLYNKGYLALSKMFYT